MEQPPGHDDGSGRVWKLHRAIYGLPNAPRERLACFAEFITSELGYVAFDGDAATFILVPPPPAPPASAPTSPTSMTSRSAAPAMGRSATSTRSCTASPAKTSAQTAASSVSKSSAIA